MAGLPIVSSKKKTNSVFAAAAWQRRLPLSATRFASCTFSTQSPGSSAIAGGKDSTAVLQLVWLAVRDLPPEQRQKSIHVVSTGTLVEQPIVASWVLASHAKMRTSADEQQIPIIPHRLVQRPRTPFG